MQAIHQQTLPPSGHEYAVSLRLTPLCLLRRYKVIRNLVLARSNYLQIFNVVLSEDDTTTASLVHVRSHMLHGIVTGLARLKTLDTAVDNLHRLLVSFKDAKFVVLEWSNEVYDLVPVSLHSLERLPGLVSSTTDSTHQNVLRVDPQSRCATLLLPSEHDPLLAILPFFQEESGATGDEALTANTSLPYSPSFVLGLTAIHPQIRNVIDHCFLDGFNEPTLAVLYTPEPSAATRIDFPGEKDNVSLVVIALDLSGSTSTTHAIISHLQNALPYDSHALYACPRELGNVLVASGSALLHVDQSGKSTGVALNAWHKKTSNIVLPSMWTEAKQETSPSFLENSSVLFVSPHEAFLFLASGLVYTITFKRDGRTLSAIIVGSEAIATGPVPSAVEFIGREFMYIASAVSPGTLLKWNGRQSTAIASNSTGMDIDADDDMLYGHLNGNATDIVEDDDLYGTSTKPNGLVKVESTLPPANPLSWCDTLDAYGPVKSLAVGTVAVDSQPELVACTGGLQSGGITIFHRGITPRKRRKLNLPLDERNPARLTFASNNEIYYTADSKCNRASFTQQGGEPFSTLKVEEEILAEADIGKAIVRVTPSNLTYTPSGASKPSQRISLPKSYNLQEASIDVLYILLCSENATTVYMINDESISKQPLISMKKEKPQSVCLYHDEHDMMPCVQHGGSSERLSQADSPVKLENGDSDVYTKPNINGTLKPKRSAFLEDAQLSPTQSSHYIVNCAEDGLLSICTLGSNSQALFTCASLCYLPAILQDGPDHAQEPIAPPDDSQVVEVLLADLGKQHKRPHLAVLLRDGTMAIYEAIFHLAQPDDARNDQRLAIRFIKITQQEIQSTIDDTDPLPIKLPYRRLSPVVSAGTGSGIFVAGSDPHWVMASDHGSAQVYQVHHKPILQIHARNPLSTDFIFVDAEGAYLACLDSACYDGPLPWTPVNAGRTYTDLVYDRPSESFVVACMFETPFVLFEDERPVWTAEDPALSRPYPCSFRSCLELITPGSWETIDGHEFRHNEVVMSMKAMALESKSSATGYKDYIGVGTAVNQGEDNSVRGAIYVFEVVKVNEDDENTANNRRLHLLFYEDLKHTVSDVSDINGYLVHSMGLKLYVKALENDERLLAVAFLDVGAHITSLRILKNFILIGDVIRGVSFVAFQEDPFKLVLLGRDLRNHGSVSADFMVYENKVAFVVTDRAGVVRLLEYNPLSLESRAGERLLCRTEYQTASEAVATLMYAKQSMTDSASKQSGLLIGASDGSLQTIAPLKDAVSKRLQSVERQLYRYSPSFSGLNPRDFRTVRNDYVSRALSKGILDGLLLDRYPLLHALRQGEMAKASNTTSDTIRFNVASVKGPW